MGRKNNTGTRQDRMLCCCADSPKPRNVLIFFFLKTNERTKDSLRTIPQYRRIFCFLRFFPGSNGCTALSPCKKRLFVPSFYRTAAK